MRTCENCKKQRDCNKRIGFTNSYGMIHHEDLTYCSAFESYVHNSELTNLKPLYNMVIKEYGKFIDYTNDTECKIEVIINNVIEQHCVDYKNLCFATVENVCKHLENKKICQV